VHGPVLPPEDGGTAVCIYGGKLYEPNASFPSEDGCNTCTWDANGRVGCTQRASPVTDGGAAGCFYRGKRYEEGAKFPS
jgi:hypothetical protein